ncbi:MAG: hypothetical protein ABI697_07980 [Devosia sp.]
MPTIGKERAKAAKEPISDFQLADEEQEMRDRVWRFLVAPHSYDWFGDTAAELARTHIVPDRRTLRRDGYYLWLHGETFASSRTRYSQLADDVGADIDTLPTTFAAICAVQNIDHQRAVAARNIDTLEAAARQSLRARRVENDTVVASFVAGLSNRYDSYGYALDHLLVETPHREALSVDAVLSDVAVYVGLAQQGDFCAGPGQAGGIRASTTVASRYRTFEPPAAGS